MLIILILLMPSNPFAQWANAAGTAFQNLTGTNSALSYTRPAALAAPANFNLPGVPSQYQQPVEDDINHTGMGTSTILGMLKNENGGNWSPTLRGQQNPNDVGPAQINTSPTGAGAELAKTPYFQNAYGHPFNVNNGGDNVRGMGVYLNYIKQYLLPAQGIKNPTDEQVIGAYNNLAPSIAKAYAARVQQRIATIPSTSSVATTQP